MEGFDSVDEIQAWVLESLLGRGEPTRTRGLDTLELSSVSLALRNPRRRCITNPVRRWSLPLALGEFCWHVSGSNELRFVEYYSKRWREFTDDGATIRGSCYGHRVFRKEGQRPSQWEGLVSLLKAEPQSRRAVLSFLEPERGLSPNAKDVACACTMQFMVRSGRLQAMVYMRSNDAVWGLPYDIFLFTMLQELLACELGVELGSYFHFVGSLHLYERHFQLARHVVESRTTTRFEMPAMVEHRQLQTFLRIENHLRSGAQLSPELIQAIHSYWQDLVLVLDWYGGVRRFGNYETALKKVPKGSPYAPLLENMVPVITAESTAHAGN